MSDNDRKIIAGDTAAAACETKGPRPYHQATALKTSAMAPQPVESTRRDASASLI
jgi:hypothetical protein